MMTRPHRHPRRHRPRRFHPPSPPPRESRHGHPPAPTRLWSTLVTTACDDGSAGLPPLLQSHLCGRRRRRGRGRGQQRGRVRTRRRAPGLVQAPRVVTPAGRCANVALRRPAAYWHPAKETSADAPHAVPQGGWPRSPPPEALELGQQPASEKTSEPPTWRPPPPPPPMPRRALLGLGWQAHLRDDARFEPAGHAALGRVLWAERRARDAAHRLPATCATHDVRGCPTTVGTTRCCSSSARAPPAAPVGESSPSPRSTRRCSPTGRSASPSASWLAPRRGVLYRPSLRCEVVQDVDVDPDVGNDSRAGAGEGRQWCKAIVVCRVSEITSQVKSSQPYLRIVARASSPGRWRPPPWAMAIAGRRRCIP